MAEYDIRPGGFELGEADDDFDEDGFALSGEGSYSAKKNVTFEPINVIT